MHQSERKEEGQQEGSQSFVTRSHVTTLLLNSTSSDQVTESRPLSEGGDNAEEECWEAVLWDRLQAPYCGVTEDVSKSIQDSNHLGQKQQVRNISHYVFKMKWEEL